VKLYYADMGVDATTHTCVDHGSGDQMMLWRNRLCERIVG